MKKSKKLIIIVLLMTTMLFPTVVLAEENLKEDITDNQYEVTASKRIKTITIYDENENAIASRDFEVSGYEYENEIPVPGEYMFLATTKAANTDVWETTYKILTLQILQWRGGSNAKKIVVNNHWKTIPKVKELDIIGVHFVSGGRNLIQNDTFVAKQIADGEVLTYTSGSDNRVSQSNGQAVVMNIVNSTSKSLDNTLEFVMGGDNDIVVNASYQHNTSNDVTYAQAKNFTFGSSTNDSNKICLGGVFIYPRSIGQYKYDQTQGVSVAYNPLDF